MEAELEFIENYYKFFITKNSSFNDFKGACDKLIEAGQISSKAYDAFIKKSEIKLEIDSKKDEILQLENKLASLRREITNLEKKLPKGSRSAGIIERIISDPCRPSIGTRSSC